MIHIPAASLKEASKLLNRVRFTRAVLPVLTHVLATADQTGVTLAYQDALRKRLANLLAGYEFAVLQAVHQLDGVCERIACFAGTGTPRS